MAEFRVDRLTYYVKGYKCAKVLQALAQSSVPQGTVLVGVTSSSFPPPFVLRAGATGRGLTEAAPSEHTPTPGASFRSLELPSASLRHLRSSDVTRRRWQLVRLG